MFAMFPGQGSQYPRMGKQLLDNFPLTKPIFEQAEDLTKLLITKYCCDDGYEEELKKTTNQQPCILTVSYAIWQVLKEETALKPDFFAGHSLGEYSALTAAGKLAFDEAVVLVKLRGEAMQAAVPLGQGAMAAVLRYDQDQLIALCQQTSNTLNQVVEVVNFNSSQQQIVSGHKEAVLAVCKELKTKRVLSKLLPVSAPFHSKLMQKAKEKMQSYLENLTLIDTSNPIIANLTGLVEQPYRSKLLIDQIDHPVYWEKSLQTAYANHVKTYIEIGPSKVLWGLARKTLPKEETTFLHTEDLVESLKRSCSHQIVDIGK